LTVKPTSFDAYVRVPSRSDTLSRAAAATVINAAVQPDMTQTGGYAAEVPFVDLAPNKRRKVRTGEDVGDVAASLEQGMWLSALTTPLPAILTFRPGESRFDRV
jgi:hypothetical protein